MRKGLGIWLGLMTLGSVLLFSGCKPPSVKEVVFVGLPDSIDLLVGEEYGPISGKIIYDDFSFEDADRSKIRMGNPDKLYYNPNNYTISLPKARVSQVADDNASTENAWDNWFEYAGIDVLDELGNKVNTVYSHEVVLFYDQDGEGDYDVGEPVKYLTINVNPEVYLTPIIPLYSEEAAPNVGTNMRFLTRIFKDSTLSPADYGYEASEEVAVDPMFRFTNGVVDYSYHANLGNFVDENPAANQYLMPIPKIQAKSWAVLTYTNVNYQYSQDPFEGSNCVEFLSHNEDDHWYMVTDWWLSASKAMTMDVSKHRGFHLAVKTTKNNYAPNFRIETAPKACEKACAAAAQGNIMPDEYETGNVFKGRPSHVEGVANNGVCTEFQWYEFHYTLERLWSDKSQRWNPKELVVISFQSTDYPLPVGNASYWDDMYFY